MLLNSVPEHVEFEGVLEELEQLEGVVSVHDLHIWGISSKTVRRLTNLPDCFSRVARLFEHRFDGIALCSYLWWFFLTPCVRVASVQVALSVHILANTTANVLSAAQKVCKRHGINHTTIQVCCLLFSLRLHAHHTQHATCLNLHPHHKHEPAGTVDMIAFTRK